jgi:Arc/MetJ-type ribon-helix-helix transcriptional regulator
MTFQLAIRIDEQLASELDALVPDRYPNRTEAVRAALAEFVDRERRAEIGRQIVAGYDRIAPGELSETVAVAADHAAARLEPWEWSDE